MMKFYTIIIFIFGFIKSNVHIRRLVLLPTIFILITIGKIIIIIKLNILLT